MVRNSSLALAELLRGRVGVGSGHLDDCFEDIETVLSAIRTQVESV